MGQKVVPGVVHICEGGIAGGKDLPESGRGEENGNEEAIDPQSRLKLQPDDAKVPDWDRELAMSLAHEEVEKNLDDPNRELQIDVDPKRAVDAQKEEISSTKVMK